MAEMCYYEIIVIYDTEYGEVIIFESNTLMNDSNDIITDAVKKQLIEEKYRSKVRIAQAISEYECEYIRNL